MLTLVRLPKLLAMMALLTVFEQTAYSQSSFKPLVPLKTTVSMPFADEAAKDAQLRAALKDPSKLLAKPPRLNVKQAIVFHLIKARQLAGQKNNAYRSHLISATTRVTSLSEDEKNQVLAFSLGIWRAASGPKAAWTNPPVTTKNYPDSRMLTAVGERVALMQWQAKQYDLAVSKYKKLSEINSGNELAAVFDRRALEMQEFLYRKNDNAAKYERALVKAKEKYSTADLTGGTTDAQAQTMAAFVNSRYRIFVANEIRVGKMPKTSNARRSVIIRSAKRFIESLPSEQEKTKEPLLADVAKLHTLNKEYRSAVTIYLALAETKDTTSKRSYLNHAVAAQMQLANWPISAPWNGGMKPGNIAQREELLSIYQKLSDTYADAIFWPAVAHIGLLNIALDNTGNAYTLWKKALDKKPVGTDAANAAGYLITVYERSKNWDELENITKVAMRSRLTPIRGTRKFDMREILVSALLNGGRQKIAEQKYADAVTKLKEFVDGYASHKKHADGMFYLAFAYRGDGKHPESLAMMESLTKVHPASTFAKKAFLTGGEWALSTAQEDKAIYFYQGFADNFAKDKEAATVREQLADLYIGRELYGPATEVLRAQMTAKNVSRDVAAEAATKLLDIEEKYGTVERASSAAAQLLTMNQEAKVRAVALATQARYYSEKNDLAKLQSVEQALSQLPSDQPEVQEATGEVRYYLAEKTAPLNRKKIFNLSLKDPLKTLNDEFAKFSTTRASYERVCAVGTTSFCAPALHQLARHADRLYDRIRDVAIPENYDEKIVKGFNDRKIEIQDSLVQLTQSYDEKSVVTVNEGNTSPVWTQAILWQNTADWNFDRVSGETGNGYVQFKPAND
jgi:TolA-binding protein